MRIVVIGSCIVDIGMRLERLPRPGETLFAEEMAVTLGGKGLNQAVAAARLGAEVTLIGKVGTDEFGMRMLEAMAAEGIDGRYVAQDSRAPTGMAVPMVLPDGANSIVSAPGANLLLTEEEVSGAASAIRAADVVLIQMEVSLAANLRAARIAWDAGVPLLLNPAPAVGVTGELLALARYLVPNEVEAEALSGVTGDAGAAGRALYRDGMGAVVVTTGALGCTVIGRDGAVQIPAWRVDAVDTVGAGDAFCGAFAVAIGEGAEVIAAARFANAAAAVSVQRRGTSTGLATWVEVAEILGQR